MTKKVETFGSEGEWTRALVAERDQPYPVPENWCWTRVRYVAKAPAEDPLGGDGTRGLGPLDRETGGAGGWTALERPGVDPLYFHYYLCTELFRSQADAGETGDCIFPIPPLLEQRRIVLCVEGLFSRLRDARKNLRWLVDSHEARKAEILQRAFAGELTEKWRAERGVERTEWGRPREGEEPSEEEKQAAVMVENLFAKERQSKTAAEAALLQVERTRRFILDRAFRGELGTNDPAEESGEELLKRILAAGEAEA